MHGWGPWYPVAAVSLAAGCYLLGRRGHTGAVWVVLGLTEVLSTVAVTTGRDSLGWLVDQLVVILGGLLGALLGAYRRLRHDLMARGWAQAEEARVTARLRERARIAAEVHDTLGHDLTLLSLAAGGLQVTATEPAVRAQAATLRASAAAAVATLRRLVDVLGDDTTPGGASPGRDADLAAVVSAFRAAGAVLTVEGELPATLTEAARRQVSRVVQQALTNAVQHAPGEPIAVGLTGEEDAVTITCTNRVGSPPTVAPPRPGSGLAALAGQLRSRGGLLHVDRTPDQFRLIARIPGQLDLKSDVDSGDGGDDEVGAEFHGRRRQARGALMATVLAPLIALIVLVTGFYTWAAYGATVEPGDYARLAVGMSEPDALAILPARQSPLHPTVPREGGDCRFHSNGDYPLAWGNLVICFQDHRISSLTAYGGGSS